MALAVRVTHENYMTIESITEEQIKKLLEMPKRVKNPGARSIEKGIHQQKNYRVIGDDETSFILYLRQNTKIREDYSCGLSWNMPSGDVLTLVRYNGPSHNHKNHIEGDVLDLRCHIHRATKQYIDSGRKPEGYAEETSKYSSLSGALDSLVNDCMITGISTDPDHPDLFK